jgi:FAD/FMN-containing dehydrogenase/Fe-S oxidoreductase
MTDRRYRKREHVSGTLETEVDAERLSRQLKKTIEGEVRFDAGSRALYATDASNYRQVPIGVVIPKTVDDVLATVGLARQYGAPILARGGGTSLAGQCCNVAVLMDMSKYLNRILAVDPERKQARVQPGVVLDTLRTVAKPHKLTFGPDPATHSHCTLGGMIGNNSCGVHSLMAGRTADNIDELEILTYQGIRLRVRKTSEAELNDIQRAGGDCAGIYFRLRQLAERYADRIRQRYPHIPRRVSGYNLEALLPENGFHVARALVGSECTCVVVLEATTRLVNDPPARSLVVLGYPDVYQAGDHIQEILEFGPIGLEGLDDRLVEQMRIKGMHNGTSTLLPSGGGWLLVEFGGETREDVDEKAHRLMNALSRRGDAPSMKLFDDPDQERLVWEIRESGLGATARVPGEKDAWEGWEDSAVPPAKVGQYLRRLRSLLQKHGYNCALYGHLGQGCVHTRIDFDLKTAKGIQNYRSFISAASDLVLTLGGSFSGEHGDGQSRAELLQKMYGPDLIAAFREFKSIWDPRWKMNPGKLVAPYRMDENLRLGADYHPWEPRTHFMYPDDNGSFAYASERCVGVGKCRRDSGGIMCPSFMVTREEMHSTRGRAHLLFEMLQGDPLRNGWRDHHVREALDLCLACKGCKSECPLNVDMATYKAEFLSHYYEGRLRPLTAYTMGRVHQWVRIGSLLPELTNLLTHAPALSMFAKWAAGISIDREIPAFAPQTFKNWFGRRGVRSDETKPSLILWPDTFTNHFHPEVGEAAVEVLESAGFRVEVPRPFLCCGRPLYDHGLLNDAKDLLLRTLSILRNQIRAGMPIVVLEPSCAAVFRDELVNLLPHDMDALRLSRQTFVLSEFLEKMAPHFQLPQLRRKAIVQSHCHHAAIMKLDAEKKVLSRMGLDYEVLDSGCCGMAGSFGFERGDKYRVSVEAGERVLLPRVREADRDVLIVANGFSCREQIAQRTLRRALHLAQVIRMGLRRQVNQWNEFPERWLDRLQNPNANPLLPAARTTAVVLGAGALAYAIARRFLACCDL